MTASVGSEGALRKVLFSDALTCSACGALMCLGAAPLSALTAIPERLLFFAGASLFPSAALMAFVAARGLGSLVLVWLVIGGNAAWTLASLWLLLESGLGLNLYGQLFVGLQAAVVSLLTVLEVRYAPDAQVRVGSVRA